MHLAQFNIARAIAPLDDPRLADFAAQLDAINAIADRAPGFVWRLHAATAGQRGYLHAPNDPALLVNLTVWESPQALHAFTYRSEHAAVFRARRRWFEPTSGPSVVLWWIPEGTLPTLDDGYARLRHLATHGSTRRGFTFKTAFPPHDPPSATDDTVTAP